MGQDDRERWKEECEWTVRNPDTRKPGSKDSPQETYLLKYNTLALAIVALRQIVAALRFLKGRKEMTAKATPAKLADFVCDSHTLVKMMQGSLLGLECSPLPELAWASTSESPKEENNQSQKCKTELFHGRWQDLPSVCN
jgi:hypothetical protein